MPGSALLLVLAAAALHAVWNALAKQARDPLAFLWSSVGLATLAFSPLGAWLLVRDGLPAAALPFLAATVALHAVYFFALSRAYGSGEYSLVYPIARGLGVALVPILGRLLLGERLSPSGMVGIALVVLGIAGISLRRGEPRPVGGGSLRAGMGWALLTGLTIASYSLVDQAGVARLHPVPYLIVMSTGMSLVLAPAVWARSGALRREWVVNRRGILAASTMNLTSYLLVLFAFRLSKAGYVVAARELSIVVSLVIGRLWLGETPAWSRLAAAGLVLAGVVCVALAR